MPEMQLERYPSQAEQPPSRVRLQPRLNLSDGAALVVSSVIGVGIFTTPAVIAALVPSAAAMLTLWVAGGFLAFAGAITYAELAKLCPDAGGEYNYLSRAFGPLAGFLAGWTSLIAGFSGAVAASAVAFASFLGRYFPSQTSATPLVSLSFAIFRVSVSRQALLASAIILLFALIHNLGLGPGRIAQKALASLILAVITVLIVAGLFFGHGSWSHFQSVSTGFRIRDWLLALIPVMFTYSGWNAAAYVSEEMHDSRRTVGAALAWGTGIVLVVYVALNAVFVRALPMPEMASKLNVGDAAAQKLFGVAGGFLTPVLLIALLGAISAMTIAGPRVYFAMARDGVFFRSFGRISAKFGTPSAAILLQAAWSVVLVLLGEFEQILIYTGFAVVLSSGATVTALYVIRRRKGLRGNPVRTLVMPAVFALASFLMLTNAIWRAPAPSLIGLLLIAAGVPFFVLARKEHAEGSGILVPSSESAAVE